MWNTSKYRVTLLTSCGILQINPKGENQGVDHTRQYKENQVKLRLENKLSERIVKKWYGCNFEW